MGISSKYPLLLTSGVTLVLGARLLVSQAQVFLQEHGGPALNRLQIWSVTFVFTCTSLVLIFGALADIASWPDVSRSIVLLAWGIPMVLLDMRNYWLPLRYTTGFWLTGLLFTLLPGSSLTLAEALSEGRIGGACIDVFEKEPPVEKDHPLFSAPNIIVTPHVAFATKEALVKRAVIVFDNVAAYLDGTPKNVME